MKKILLISVILLGAAIAVYFLFLKEPTFNAKDGYLNNIDKRSIILQGYDAVAYFTDNKPVMGNASFTENYQGAIYWFASVEHKAMFKADPVKYAPQYGAFCGYAVSIGKLRPVDPTIYQIEDGRLILQHTKEAYDLFNEDLKGNTVKADMNWPGIVANHVGKPVNYDMPATASATILH
ncbi:MAG: YHS domain-containing (seleno)protein [Ferruginibacter sp.]